MKKAYLLSEESNVLSRLVNNESIPFSQMEPLMRTLKEKGFVLEKKQDQVSLKKIEDRAFPYYAQLFKDNSRFIRQIISFIELGSTNDYMKKNRECLDSGTVVFAENQKKGKGKWDRTWFMQEGKSLIFSLCLDVQLKEKEHIGFLTMACALSVCLAAQAVAGAKATCKWPNDVLVGGRKLCGILTESFSLNKDKHRVIIGVGVNVNYKKADFPYGLQETAVSLSQASGREISRFVLFSSFMHFFIPFFHSFEKQDFKDIVDRWNEYVYFKESREILV